VLVLVFVKMFVLLVFTKKFSVVVFVCENKDGGGEHW
jgi:hypothetical protein